MPIPMRPSDAARHHRPSARFPSARAAFESYLRARHVTSGRTIALPAYIGWSAREGSGVFDPVAAVGAQPTFYRMTRDLQIDLADLERVLADRPDVLVLIHYFGWPDRQVREALALARAAGVPVMEDEAHAMLSDVVGASCGRDGEAAIFSSHKMLATMEGGELVANSGMSRALREAAFAGALSGDQEVNRRDYDLTALATVRRANAATLLELLRGVAGVRPLWPEIPAGVVPQTLPVIIERVDRDALYHQMNAAGFGVTSLYHTMIDELDAKRFPDAHWLSRHIMNLPVHQDVTPAELPAMVSTLGRLVAA